MIEFLIKRKDGDWFDFTPDSDPYRPISLPYKKVHGWGDARIEVDGCEISFSYEDPGIQVSFEGEITAQAASLIIDEIRQRVEQVSGQRAESIQIA